MQVVGLLALMVSASPSWAGAKAASCLSIVQWHNQTEFMNRCDYPISVMWCSLGQPYIGERCGDHQAVWSDYYSHRMVIPADGIAVKPTLAELEIAVCQGALYGDDLIKRFISDAKGDYQCL